jgi:DNA-binding NarL/FixJ family response regulator
MADMHGIAGSLERLGWIAAERGEYERAARMIGAADRQWRIVGQILYGASSWLQGRQECETRARRALGDDAYETALEHGGGLSLAEAVRYALGDDRPGTRTPARSALPPPAGPDDMPLTRREQEVAQLVAQGLSNKQIATQLVLSQRTAESHVENILRKLGFTSRTQIATWATQNDDL